MTEHTWKPSLQIGKVNAVFDAQYGTSGVDTLQKYLTALPSSTSKLDAVIKFDHTTGDYIINMSPHMLEPRDDMPDGQLLPDLLQHGGVVLAFPPGYYEDKPDVNMVLDSLAVLGLPDTNLGEVIAVVSPYLILRSDLRLTPRGCQRIQWQDILLDAGYARRGAPVSKHTLIPPKGYQVFTFPWTRFVSFVQLYQPSQLSLQNVHWIDHRDYAAATWGELSLKTLALVDELERIAGCYVTSASNGAGHMLWR